MLKIQAYRYEPPEYLHINFWLQHRLFLNNPSLVDQLLSYKIKKKKKNITVWKQKRVLLVLLKKSIARKNELQHKLSCKVSRVSSDQIKWSHLSFKLFMEEKTTSYFARRSSIWRAQREIFSRSHIPMC